MREAGRLRLYEEGHRIKLRMRDSAPSSHLPFEPFPQASPRVGYNHLAGSLQVHFLNKRGRLRTRNWVGRGATAVPNTQDSEGMKMLSLVLSLVEKEGNAQGKAQPVSGHSFPPSRVPAAALNVLMRTLPGTTWPPRPKPHA